MATRRALLLVSRGAGRGEGDLRRLLDALRTGFREVRVHRQRDPRRFAPALRAHAEPGDVVLVAGGDGTVNAVLPALLELRAVLGVLPFGTGNDLARTLGLPLDPCAAAAALVRGRVREIDCGLANGLPYLNVASIGLPVSVARRLGGTWKRRLGPLGYPLAAADAVRAARPFRVRVEGPDGPILAAGSLWLAVANGRSYGGGTPLAEDAAIDDGRLDLRNLRPLPAGRLLRMAFAVRRGTQHRFEEVDAAAGPWFRVTTSRRKRVAMDGEVRTRTPVLFQVRPKALRVLAPEAL